MSEGHSATLGVRSSSAPPVRIVHLGLGAFHRAHQAWYTARSSDASCWGIAAYSGRSAALPDALDAQDGLYTLIERSALEDRAERVDSIVRAHAGTDVPRLLRDLASADTAIVTLTITEAAYADESIATDTDLFARLGDCRDLDAVHPESALGRLVLGLEARRRARGPALALLSCDNLPDNGGVLRRAVLRLATSLDGLPAWVESNVSFVSSSVDRITPRLDPEEAAELSARLGDRAPVVTEPFSDWAIEGVFPAGRPDWESAGARVVDDIEPWEARKLWLLNGAHTLLASLGRLRGHRSVAEAIADPECRRAVDAFWDEACRHLPQHLELAAYRAALIDRFENPRIVHRLEQIAQGAATKVRLRIVPVARREREAGRTAHACAAVIAAWIAAERMHDASCAIERDLQDVSVELAADAAFADAVREAYGALLEATVA